MTTVKNLAVAATLTAVASIPAMAQQPTPPYRSPISLEQAKRVIAAAEAEAQKNNWPVSITVVDSDGFVVAMHRMGNTQLGSIPAAEDKARTSVLFRRPSKAFEDAVAGGGIGLRVLGLRGGTVNLIGSGRDKAGEAGHTNAYAQAAMPVTSAQVWKTWVRAARYWSAGR